MHYQVQRVSGRPCVCALMPASARQVSDYAEHEPLARLSAEEQRREKAALVRVRRRVLSSRALMRCARPYVRVQGVPTHCPLLANFNSLYKIDPVSFQLWLNVMARVPCARLWLVAPLDDARANLAAEARARGVHGAWCAAANARRRTHGTAACAPPHLRAGACARAATRLLLSPYAERSQHVRRARAADLFVDSLDVNAHRCGAA